MKKSFRAKYTKIDGLSERRRLPRLGKIRLGIKKVSKKSGKEYPVEVDYFVCPPEVQAIYGEKPKELDIMIPVDDLNIILPTAYKWWGKSFGLKCFGNGKSAMRSFDEKGMKEVDCPCEKLKTKENPKGDCSQIAHFLFILPKVNMGGVYQIDTSSINSIIDIQSGLEYTAQLVASVTGNYRFSLIPLKLTRIKRETHGSGIKETHYTLMVQSAINITQLNELSVNVRQIPSFEVEVPKLTEAVEIEGIIDEEDMEVPSQEVSTPTKEAEKGAKLKEEKRQATEFESKEKSENDDNIEEKEYQRQTEEDSNQLDSEKKDLEPEEEKKKPDMYLMSDSELRMKLAESKGGAFPSKIWDKYHKEILGGKALIEIDKKGLIKFGEALKDWHEKQGEKK